MILTPFLEVVAGMSFGALLVGSWHALHYHREKRKNAEFQAEVERQHRTDQTAIERNEATIATQVATIRELNDQLAVAAESETTTAREIHELNNKLMVAQTKLSELEQIEGDHAEAQFQIRKLKDELAKTAKTSNERYEQVCETKKAYQQSLVYCTESESRNRKLNAEIAELRDKCKPAPKSKKSK